MIRPARLPRPPGARAGATVALLAAALAAPCAGASIGLGSGATRASVAVDARGDALVRWSAAGVSESVLIPPSGELSHGDALAGPDVSRPAHFAGLPDAVVLRHGPAGTLFALQEIQMGANAPPQLDFSRWQGAATTLTLAVAGNRLEGEARYQGTPVSGTTFTLAGKKPRIYVYLDCFGCGGRPGWSAMLGVPPEADGSFAVYLRASWVGTRYRATVAGPNRGTTLAPDAQTTIAAGS